jgi:L,D-peptidoglycan transpeptidase YkuD (ErfK/YbiS/YcfS/YnhG family)|tara:strand:+ start:2765 stop:3256 length:492 start_codon:yes stop_codon:yes gene_type:complete
MHILVKNKFLYYKDYKVKCAIGKRGINIKKKEGDLITPRGTFKVQSVLYRKDRVKKLKSNINKIIITKKIGWCDDSKSRKYNKLVKIPFDYSYEKLHKTNNTYDIILVLDYNMNPIKKNKGSAIFIHVIKKKYSATKGCVAVKKKDLIKLIGQIDKKTIVKII